LIACDQSVLWQFGKDEIPARDRILAPVRGSRAIGVGEIARFMVAAEFFDGERDERKPE